MSRGEGTTTTAMKNTKLNGLYVWCNSHLGYPTALAKRLGREDLKIVRPEWLSIEHTAGAKFTDINIDHAARLTAEQFEAFCNARLNVK